MADEQSIETSQFSFSGQKYQAEEGFVGYFEPGQLDQLEANGRLFLVADGVGGAASGALASHYAVQKVLHDFYNGTGRDLEARLMTVIRKVNTEILERNSRFPERRPMGTTLLAALIYRNKLWVANVGDGRVYVVWDHDIEQLTRDAASGESKIEPAEAAQPDPGRQLTRLGLGLDDQVKIDVFSRKLFPGDTVVLGSGGLVGYLTEEEIAKTISRFPPTQASRQLAELAVRRGSRDTISVSVARLLPKPVTPAALRPKPLPPAPDWNQLSRLGVKSQPIDSNWARSRLAEAGSGRAQARWRWGGCFLVVLLLGVVLGVAATQAWSAWLASETADVSVVGSEEAVAATPEVAATAGSAASPTPGPTEGQLVVERNSPLSPLPTPTIQASRSTGETISSTRPAGQSGPAQAVAAVTVTPASSPLPTIVLPPGCTNKGRFAGDVTVPDGQKFAPAEQFNKTWSVANYGTCPWGAGYTLRFVSGDRLGADKQALTEVVEPEAMGDITVPMVAPVSSGTYSSTWQLYSPAGEAFGPELYVKIEVLPAPFPPAAEANLTTLYDFVANATQAVWTAGDLVYTVQQVPINRDLVIPFPEGIVAVGPAEFGGDYQAPGNVLLTHPHQEIGYIQGTYNVATPLQPTDAIMAILGFPKAAVINDDGASFKVSFKPTSGSEQVIFSRLVQYDDSPVAIKEMLTGLKPGQIGTFTLRVEGGASLSYDWATWIELRLVRP